MELKAVATLELFRVSSLKSSGILTKFLAKQISNSDVVRIPVNRFGKNKTEQVQGSEVL